MGSRRMTTRSTSWNGRSTNGDVNGGSSRPGGGRSYLSNVRPENRSTLCSVMAQLTEETQPSFQTTLKSKAVSENCNVKFSCVVTGYPAPQVNWYKDDMQLDRYCGLPKYEIFRNGQSHSLHIYNCTVEDAAIYQASAINSKGIVSCSGVLEVGEMNEFRIHQRYFAKIKQKAELKRREAEGKENQEPLRTISPDRTLRKRRSTMEAFLSTPSSTEDESNEESHQAVAVNPEDRLQEATVEEVGDKPVTNGQVVNENGNNSGTYIYDSAQKTFIAHQPKTPFAKKKIKISNSAKVAKADTLGERVSEERRARDETLASAALARIDPVLSRGNLEEVMEVEKPDRSTHVESDSRHLREQCQKSATEKAMLVERPSKDKNECVVPSQGAVPASPAALTSTGDTVSGNGGKQATKCEREVGREGAGEGLQMQRQSPYLGLNTTATQPSVSSIPRSVLKEDIIKTEEATAMDTDERSDASTGGSLAQRDLQSVDTPCEIRTALPQHPCEHAGDQLSDKETSPCQENVSEPLPALLSEVKQAHTKMNRNDAPVNPELPLDPCTMDTHQPQKSPSESEATTDDILTPSVHCGLQATIDKMTQGTRDHSRGSNQSPVVLFTDLQKSPFEIPHGAESTPGCIVSPGTPQSQVDTAIKTVEGIEIQVDEKVEGNKVAELLVEAPNEKTVEMETETIALCMGEHTQTENTKDVADKDADNITVEASWKEKNKTMLDVERRSELQHLKLNESEAAMSHLTNKPENTNTPEQIIEFNEIPKPVSKVISIAEIMRSQIRALDLSSNVVPTIPVHSDFVQEPTTAVKTCQELRDGNRKCKLEVKMPKPGKKTEAIIDNIAAKNVKVTPMKVAHQPSKTEQTESVTSPPAKALQKPLVVETTGPHGRAKKYNKGAMDTDQETGTSNLVPSYRPVVSLTESERVTSDKFLLSTSKEEVTNRPPSISNLSGTVSQGSGTPIQVSCQESNITIAQDEPVQGKGMDLIQKLTPEIKLNSKSERGVTERNSTTQLERCHMGEHDTNTSSSQKIPTQSVFGIDTQDSNCQPLQQDSFMVEEFSRTDSLTTPTLETSPLLKKRNCVSPIPSATPQELASGARRKIQIPKAKAKETTEATSPTDNLTQKKELSPSSVTPSVSPSLSRRSHLLQPAGEQTSLVERRSPLLSRRKTASETQSPSQQPTEVNTLKTEAKPTEKDKYDPFKAPQVIRKIRGETFADASGHFKLWCQFFNVLSDSTIKWYKNEEEIAQIKRNAGDETQVNLAIVQASSRDSGVYRCSITNEYGTDSTDTLLSTEILAGMSLREDLGVGEEIEMTPLIFSKGVADSGIWANKLFGRIMMQESHIGDGCSHKVWRAKVIYGLEPVFESGNTCIIKVHNPIAYSGKEERCLMERNLDIIKQECKIQNLAREYCKIFSAEARVIENFGPTLEVVPVYLIYRPANTVPYATVEADLTGVYQKYSVLDHTGRLDVRTSTVVDQKCCALQHWIFQWTNGNLLLTRLEGVDTKITNVGISVKSTGHQALSVEGNPKVFEQFVSQHQCNYFCGLLGLRSLKVMDSLLTPAKPKGSRSPLLQRKMAPGSSSPQTGRKAAGSPRLPRKAEQEGRKTPTKQKVTDAPKVVKMA